MADNTTTEQSHDLKVCRDEVLAVLMVRGGQYQLRKTANYDTCFVGLDAYDKFKDRFKKPIVVVTESPHIEEFIVHGVRDILTGEHVHARPVNGATGRNIRDYLAGLLFREQISLEDGNYPVIVINALHEQCSLGVKDTCVHRTKNFLRLWADRKVFLEQRLSAIEPLLVINACTVGDFYTENGSSAYSSGNRNTFEQHFIDLVQQQTGLSIAQSNQNITEQCIGASGSIDLAGLTMFVIDKVYNGRTLIAKTTHPAAWSRKQPSFQRRRNRVVLFTPQ